MNETDNQEKSKDIQAEGGREGWNADEISVEASQQDEDEVQRQIKRGDESKGDANDRDHAGTSSFKDTPQGREEAKNDTKGKANDNG